MGELASGEEENMKHKGLFLFGIDLMKIECLRGSLLNGYVGAAVGGLGGFMYTSSIKKGCHSAFVSYWVVAFSSWMLCRYNKYHREKEWEHLKKVVNERAASKDEYHLPKEFKKSSEAAMEEVGKKG